MNIVIVGVAPPFRGGISLHNAVLFSQLEITHKVTCFNFKRQYPEFLFPGKTQYESGKSAVDIPSIKSLDSINPITWYSTSKKIINIHPDLVIFRCWNSFFSLMMGLIAKTIKYNNQKVHLMAVCDNIIPHESQLFDKWLMKYFLKEMDSSIVQSGIVEKELITLLPDAKYLKLFHPIYNVFSDKIKSSIALKKLNIKKKYVILYFGMVRPYKGFDILIRSVRFLKESINDFIVLAVGESYEPEEKYRAMIKKEKIEDVFNWENRYIPDSEIVNYFSAADVVALPYKNASQSGVIQIAYHYDTPVVVTNVGGLSEMVDEGNSGNIIPPEDPIALAKTISVNLKNGNYHKMVDFISEYKNNFSWGKFIKGIESLVK